MLRSVIFTCALMFSLSAKSAPAKKEAPLFTAKLTSRLIGIVEVPTIFGEEKEGAKPFNLYVDPGADGGGKPPLITAAKPEDFISVAHDEERRAVVVYEVRNGWYRIGTVRGDAWLSPKQAGSYHSYESLVKKDGPHLTREWDKKLYSGVMGTMRDAKTPKGKSTFGVKILETKISSGIPWFRVQLITDACEPEEVDDPDAPPPVDKGWVPGISVDHRVQIWFLAEGC